MGAGRPGRGQPQPAPAPASPLLQPALAQGASTAALSAEVDKAEADLRALSRSSGGAALTREEMQARLAAIPPIQARLADALAQLTPRLAQVDARLAQLGPAPGPGQPPESAAIAESRRTLNRFHQTVDGEVKQARLLQVEAGQIGAMLANRQRQQMNAQLWSYSGSILDPVLWRDIAAALPGDAGRLGDILSGEGDALAKAAQSPVVLGVWLVALIACLAIAVPLRVLLNRLVLRVIGRAAPDTRLRRTLLALATTAIATATPPGGAVPGTLRPGRHGGDHPRVRGGGAADHRLRRLRLLLRGAGPGAPVPRPAELAAGPDPGRGRGAPARLSRRGRRHRGPGHPGPAHRRHAGGPASRPPWPWTASASWPRSPPSARRSA